MINTAPTGWVIIDDAWAYARLTHLDRQPLAGEHVYHRQRSEFLPSAEIVIDKVGAPCLVEPPGLTAGLAIHHHLAPMRLLTA